MRRTLLTAVVLALAVPPAVAAVGTNPPLISPPTTRAGITSVSIYGYDKDASYGVEVARHPGALSPDGHFLTPLLSHRALSLSPAGEVRVKWRLSPGRYVVRAFEDYTSLWLEFQEGICNVLGCVVTWDGRPRLIWAEPLTFTVPSPAKPKPKKRR